MTGSSSCSLGKLGYASLFAKPSNVVGRSGTISWFVVEHAGEVLSFRLDNPPPLEGQSVAALAKRPLSFGLKKSVSLDWENKLSVASSSSLVFSISNGLSFHAKRSLGAARLKEFMESVAKFGVESSRLKAVKSSTGENAPITIIVNRERWRR